MEIKFLLTVTTTSGLIVRDTPRSAGQGAKEVRRLPVGSQVYAYNIFAFGKVPYALIVPAVPGRPEWVRVAEADNLTKYVDVFEMDPQQETGSVASAIIKAGEAIADAIRLIVR